MNSGNGGDGGSSIVPVQILPLGGLLTSLPPGGLPTYPHPKKPNLQ